MVDEGRGQLHSSYAALWYGAPSSPKPYLMSVTGPVGCAGVPHGPVAQLRLSTRDPTHHVGQFADRKHNLPRAEIRPIDRRVLGNRWTGTVVEETAGGKIDPLIAAADRTEAEIDGPPEPGAVHRVEKAFRLPLA